MKIDNFLEDICLKGGDRFICIKLFSDNPLRKTQYVKVSEIRESLFLGCSFDRYQPNMYRWVKKDDDTRRWEYDIDNSTLTLREIHENDSAMQEFMKKFYPEHAI